MRLFGFGVCLLLVGCGDGTKIGTDSGGDADTDTDTVDTGGDSDLVPVVTAVTGVSCAERQSAGEIWSIDFTADDPQGADTIDSGTLDVLNEQGGSLATYAAACNSGTCIASIHANYDGIACSLGGTITFRITVTDEEGYVSAPYDYLTDAP